MLPKWQRLSTPHVREVLAKGRSRRAVCLSYKYVNLDTFLRVSVVVPKSTAKTATERNRLRRAVYRALAPLSGKGHGIIFVHKVPEGALTPAFKKEVVTLLAQMR